MRSLELPLSVHLCSMHMNFVFAQAIFIIEMEGAPHGLDALIKFSTEH